MFDIDSFADIGGQTRKGMSPALWSYESLDDSLADILSPEYFEDIGLHVSRGDFISVSLVDGKKMITVQSQTNFPPMVVIDPLVFAPGGGGNVNTTDVLDDNRLLTGVGGTEIVSETNLFWDGARFGVNTDDPGSKFHIKDTSSFGGRQAGLTLEQAGTGDSRINLLITGAQTWNLGIDRSDGSKFKISDDNDFIDDPAFTILPISMFIGFGEGVPATQFHVKSSGADTLAVLTVESAGTNGAAVRDFISDRDPEGNITGNPGDRSHRGDGEFSGMSIFKGASAGTAGWKNVSLLEPDILELHNSAELDALASGGVITIAVPTTWHIRGNLTTANRIVVNDGVFFRITGEFNATASITYSGTDTFISTDNGIVQLFAALGINSSSTGTFFESTGSSGGLVIQQSSLAFWTDLGSIVNGQLFIANTGLFNISGGMSLINTIQVDLQAFNQFGTDLDGPLLTINTNNPNSIFFLTDVAGRNLGTGSLFDIDTRMNQSTSMVITRVSAPNAEIFKQSVLTDATINSVSDGSIATGTLTAMADNGSGGTTVSSTTIYFEDEELNLSGTTSYNGDFQIFNVVAGVSFDIIAPFVADDATGSADSDRLTLDLAGGHGISTGDSIKIIDTNFYNGFKTTLNLATNQIIVNGIFISTNTGSIERELSLDQTDPRIMGFAIRGTASSAFIATAFVNDNSTVNPAIVNNTFRDMLFGTTGDALIAASTMERWRLVDELLGIFEYIGLEPFFGKITFDFTVMSSGGTTDFRFKWQKDVGAGFVDLPDNVEALAAVGSDAQSVTKTFPINALQGDRIKPQITRNSGTSTITTTYATIFVSM